MKKKSYTRHTCTGVTHTHLTITSNNDVFIDGTFIGSKRMVVMGNGSNRVYVAWSVMYAMNLISIDRIDLIEQYRLNRVSMYNSSIKKQQQFNEIK